MTNSKVRKSDFPYAIAIIEFLWNSVVLSLESAIKELKPT